MSVIKSKRSVSGVQFLDTARELQMFTMRTCVKFPKRYTFFITNSIVQCAVNIHGFVKKGNSIFPSNAHDVQLRHEQFVMANAELQNLISQIGIAYDTFPIVDKTIKQWMELIEKEISLIKNVIKKDKERFKQF